MFGTESVTCTVNEIKRGEQTREEKRRRLSVDNTLRENLREEKMQSVAAVGGTKERKTA
jgi:hypothetical protein